MSPNTFSNNVSLITFCRLHNEIHLPPPVPPERNFNHDQQHPAHEYTNHNRSAASDHFTVPPSAAHATRIVPQGNGNGSGSAEPQLQTFNQNNWMPQQLNEPEQHRPLLPQTSSTIHMNYPTHLTHMSQTRGRHITEITHGTGGGGDSSDSGVCGGASARPREGDAMTAIIADSSTPTATSSSSDGRRSSSSATPPSALQDALPSSGNQQPHQAPQRPQLSASEDIQPYQVLPYDDKKMNPNPPSTVNDCGGGGSVSTMVKSSSIGDSLRDTGFGVVNSGGVAKFSGRGTGFDSDSGIIVARAVTVKEMSPTVFKDTVTTGGYR